MNTGNDEKPEYKTSVTGVMNYLVSPKHYHSFNVLKEREPSPAMVEGTALHLAVLEPERFEKEVFKGAIPIPDQVTVLRLVDEMKEFLTSNGESIKGLKKDQLIAECEKLLSENMYPDVFTVEQWAEANSEAIVLTDSVYDRIVRMRDSVNTHSFCSEMMGQGKVEVMVEGVIEGVKIRGRIDWLHYNEKLGKFLVMDLKKTTSSRLRKSQATVDDRFYHVQAWLYSELLRQQEGKDTLYGWIMAEGSLPYITEVYFCDEATIEGAEIEARLALLQLKQSLELDHWPGYTDGSIQNIGLPMYAWNRIDLKSRVLEEMR